MKPQIFPINTKQWFYRSYLKKGLTATSLIILTFFTSCENILEVDMPSNQIDGTVVFENAQTANAALAGLYAGLFENSPLAGDSTGALLGYYTDDLDFFYNSTNATADIFLNQQLSNNTAIETYWNNAYQKIYIANTLIEGTQKSVTLSTTDKNNITGEALLIRSIIFYYLEEIFGDIPYPTSADYKVNQSISKTNKIELLQKLEQDLLRSISLLQDPYKNTERIYPNKKVAQLLLAKIYLLQKNWSPAEQLLNEIIQSPLYIFENDLNKVFIKSSTNILWQLKPKNTNDPTKEIQLYYFSGTAPTMNALSNNLVNIFDNTDLRKTIYLTPVTVGNDTWYRANKYKNRTANTTEYSVIFRLEEVYLLMAEVYARQDKVVDALPYVNKTRQRAGLSPLSNALTNQQLLTEILEENRREFFTEMGHRFFDLKRAEQLNSLQLTKPNWKIYNSLWPLPQKEILLNPKLNPQNDGY